MLTEFKAGSFGPACRINHDLQFGANVFFLFFANNTLLIMHEVAVSGLLARVVDPVPFFYRLTSSTPCDRVDASPYRLTLRKMWYTLCGHEPRHRGNTLL